ncbi:hypothetical protein M5X04_14660 [Paenibacillus alvei]|uniref:YopX protein domain-containing protein n=1 Tax=Paenibacillus alvei TaxID=44250 RepID=A0ABT4EA03_PAEAL|nr:hypothetical protein [Paenibacillus alvei]MCY9530561.1 hypothetical protein [Paenibacillus alvei]
MSRPIIKFRGQPIEDYGDIKWFYGSAILDYEEKLAYIDAPGQGLVPVTWDTVGQIFDFGDREGGELYPGDIVKTIHTKLVDDGIDTDPFCMGQVEEYEKIGLLEYHCGYSFGPRLRWKKGHMMIPNTSTLWRLKAVKLGNKWDNPDLLKGDSKDA